MNRPLHIRLRDLRVAAGFKTQKSFLAWAEKHKHGIITYARYSALERGSVDLTATDAKVICSALKVSADLLLFGGYSGVDMRGLTAQERMVVVQLANALVTLRTDQIRAIKKPALGG